MNYREAKRILEQQNNAQEVINQYKGLETFGKRIGYSSNMELIEALLEMEPDENVLSILKKYDYLRSQSKAQTTGQEKSG
tara:strand:+ start:1153 stop:1392 length:240 start_codon:yes stop_codon:yes gene_type:complete